MTVMARTKKPSKKATDLNVPDFQEDSAERKRVLNVLAQRRYRQRKRKELETLKKQNDAIAVPNSEQILNESESDQSSTCYHRDNLGSEYSYDQTILLNDQQTFPDCGVSLQNIGESSLRSTFQGNIRQIDAETWPSYSLYTPESGSEMYATTPLSSSSASFPDEVFLPMLELNLLRACTSIAKRLSVDHLIWDLHAVSPFTQSADLTHNHLPPNLQPTLVQLTVPHHPSFDLMPWPGVRDKLILVFSQPIELRPPPAASPTAFIDFIYDMEDSAEGIRIWGDDPYAEKNWELGQKVFKRWWWAFESHIVKNSNTLREQRGATSLGCVLGEVS